MTDMIYTDKHGTEIKKGSIVKFIDQNGGMRKKWERGASTKYTLVPLVCQGRITRINSKWANVGEVWGGKVRYKRVPLTELTECAKQFYDAWSKTEHYRCM
jgi:hypothetical protein|tara:strand:+ start:99 stop:401 length:303 start_codon:yes stop_codon:yes gene_type:complete